MFRLKERQLHIMIYLMAGVGLLMFVFLGVERIPGTDPYGKTAGMESFSDGWVCSYKTDSDQKLEEYRSTEEGEINTDSKMIYEVVNLPAKLFVEANATLTMMHRAPEMGIETLYMLIETDSQALKVTAGEEVVYESSKRERRLPALHVILLSPEYRNQVLTVELTGEKSGGMEVKQILLGTRNQFWVSLLSEDGAVVVTGIVIMLLGLFLLLIQSFMKNTWLQKRVLVYGCVEGILVGLLFAGSGRFLVMLTGWNNGIYMLRTCAVVLLAVFHLMIIRCYVYKKKVLALVDAGVLLYGVFFITAMVLPALSLVPFSGLYFAGKVLFGISVAAYTVVLAVAIYEYGRREGKPVFYANIFLIICAVTQLVMRLIGRELRFNDIFIPAGLVIYILFIWVLGLKQALYVKTQGEGIAYDEAAVREEIVDRLNPNLLFASFQSLQNLIKSGSTASVKMIYYISVYLRGNLQAVELSGEMIDFEEELEHIIAYLQLQKTRNGNLNFALECKVKEFKIPRHSLVPMVENAVKYGIAGNGDQGNIVIRTYLRAEGYAVQIIDDGTGFDTKRLKHGSPTALLNLSDLLKQKCNAMMEIISKEGKGTVITIVLPMLDNEPEEELASEDLIG